MIISNDKNFFQSDNIKETLLQVNTSKNLKTFKINSYIYKYFYQKWDPDYLVKRGSRTPTIRWKEEVRPRLSGEKKKWDSDYQVKRRSETPTIMFNFSIMSKCRFYFWQIIPLNRLNEEEPLHRWDLKSNKYYLTLMVFFEKFDFKIRWDHRKFFLWVPRLWLGRLS